MVKVTLYIGLNDQDSHKQEVDTHSALLFIRDCVLKWFSGATIYEVNGIYKHKKKQGIAEKTFVVEVVKPQHSRMLHFIEQVKTQLNQETVLVVMQNVDCKFY